MTVTLLIGIDRMQYVLFAILLEKVFARHPRRTEAPAEPYGADRACLDLSQLDPRLRLTHP